MVHENRIIIDTPRGLRYIDIPDYQGETLWEAIAKYDRANSTNLEDRLEIENIVAAGSPAAAAYSCSPLSFPEDFEKILEWIFHDCKVHEEECDHDLHCFVVTMEKDGEVRTQTIIPSDRFSMETIRMDLNGGRSPLDGWEDGLGNLICWENGEEVE